MVRARPVGRALRRFSPRPHPVVCALAEHAVVPSCAFPAICPPASCPYLPPDAPRPSVPALARLLLGRSRAVSIARRHVKKGVCDGSLNDTTRERVQERACIFSASAALYRPLWWDVHQRGRQAHRLGAPGGLRRRAQMLRARPTRTVGPRQCCRGARTGLLPFLTVR